MLAGITGDMGSGKTLTLSILGEYFAHRYQVPLFANYDLQNAIRIDNLAQLWSVESGILCWQEIWVSLESRMNYANVDLTHWVNQTRKKKLLVLYDTQAMSQVEKRVRNGTQYLINTQKKNGKYILTFIEYQTGKLGRRMIINDPERFYGIYDTFEVATPIQLG